MPPPSDSTTPIPTMSTAISTKSTIYFGYGSNLWLHQMRLRCPTSKFLGVGRLDGYTWIINSRGYANVVEVEKDEAVVEEGAQSKEKAEVEDGTEGKEKYEDVVFGLVYELKAEDERRLDLNEGVPEAYTKEDLECRIWRGKEGKRVDVGKSLDEKVKMLVYIDRKRVTDSTPKKEYVYRMNMGIKDALNQGVPKKYVEQVMRRFIPEEEEKEVDGVGKRFALEQAKRFVDEN
ncbi:hypothetical protein BCR34DRAFT_568319 [Clohesyomyces aquaticus]|uniref:gamma-glutamylcyclotransferase n=1 Tax=Clohesyomyces aquaticus TaxID=1231657 RepID=A0A1Y1ZGZ5_9PLEO|nr:hypothetical protein BCR34DRAFT_568319 [Clohesyomyces aquaticus]